MQRLYRKRIVLGVGGGIAAYKSAELVRRLLDQGAEVRVVMTRGGSEFITPLAMQALSGHPVHLDLLDPAAEAAAAAGTKVVTWDSPIPSGKGESVFVAQVDFGSIGVVMADMAHSILGGAGEMAVLSATPDAANQNAWIEAAKAILPTKFPKINLVATVYGDDEERTATAAALESAKGILRTEVGRQTGVSSCRASFGVAGL